jgi:hypothetical protein
MDPREQNRDPSERRGTYLLAVIVGAITIVLFVFVF